LAKAEKNNTIIAEYAYDPYGMRTSKVANGKKIHYIYEGNKLIFEKNIITGAIKSYIYGLGKLLSRIEGTTDNEEAERYYFSSDHLGSVRVATNETREIIWKGEFSAFGQLLFEEVLDDEFDPEIIFAGHQLDENIGLYYAKARWYDAATGRFVSVDPVKDGLNWYVYAGNNPLGFIDSKGLEDTPIINSGYDYLQWKESQKEPEPPPPPTEPPIEELKPTPNPYETLWYVDIPGDEEEENTEPEVINVYVEPNAVLSSGDDIQKSPVLVIAEVGANLLILVLPGGFAINDEPAVKEFVTNKLFDQAAPIVDGTYFILADRGGGVKVSPLTNKVYNGKENFMSKLNAVVFWAALGIGEAVKSNANSGDTETYYRTMSQTDYNTLVKTKNVPATSETFISPTEAFVNNYNGVTVQLNVVEGTTNSLLNVGVGDSSNLVSATYNLPTVSKGWTNTSAFFKAEGGQINIGLGKGVALDIFNSNIITFKVVP